MKPKQEHDRVKIKVAKYNGRGEVIAQAEVDTIEQARAFLDKLDANGNVKRWVGIGGGDA
jgi:hypothetical protein